MGASMLLATSVVCATRSTILDPWLRTHICHNLSPCTVSRRHSAFVDETISARNGTMVASLSSLAIYHTQVGAEIAYV